MSNHWVTILALTLTCSLPDYFTTLAQSKETKAGTATVSGRVTIKGEPAPGITVVLQPQQMMESGIIGTIPSAKTDANGNFRVTGLTAGRYFVNPSAPEFITPGESRPGMRQGKTIIVNDGDNLEKLEIELIRGSVITGRVTGANGRPLVEERVELTKLENNGPPRPAPPRPMPINQTTDDRGIYRIYGVPEGRYLVSIGMAQSSLRMGSGTQYQKTYHPDATDQSQAKVVEVGEGEEVTGVDIYAGEAKKTYSIFGRVVNAENGRPVVGASINIGMLAPDGNRITGSGGYGVRSNVNGEFQLSNVAPGKYAAFTGGGYYPDQNVRYYSEPVIFDLGESDVHGIEIKVRNGGSISGVLVLEGTNDPAILAKLSNLMVFIHSIPGGTDQLSTPFGRQVKVNTDGSFTFQGVPPGKIILELIMMFPGLSLIRTERDGVPQPREGIDIAAGEHISNLRLVASYGALSLRGEIKIVGGTLPPEIMLYITATRVDAANDNSRGYPVDTRNLFVIEHLSAGEYELRLSISRMRPGIQNFDQQLYRKISEVKQKVVVSGNNQQPVTMTVDLSKGENNQ
ncbi:MAG: carboxypeptidase-like regulatory domain-containing protein [Acidobacteria bacterium]|nr:carboxypeptidase-like regulatory domain-containing protein [Acidobacteriota bacterium]